jgi:acetyl-CoA C-acetyltransferase
MAKLKEDIYLVAPLRTPIGKFGGTLADQSAPQLGAFILRNTLEVSGVDPSRIDGVIFGHSRQAGTGPNPARQIAIRGGLANEVPAHTINQACGSGLRAVMDSADQIRLGQASVMVAGGTESMSNTPFMVGRARWGMRMGHGELIDGMYRDGFMCPLADELMGATAENLVDKYGIPRDEQDEYAVRTQARAKTAWESGWFAREVVPYPVETRKGTVQFEQDEHPRFDATIEGMRKLKPVFREDGTVHAGNSSGITDGAACMIVAGGEAVRELGLTPAGRIIGYSQAAVDPKLMGIGPVPATRKLLEETGISLSDIDLIELNEAFAAQVLACDRELGLDHDRLNVNGGAIALGHPIGCTGARILTTLLHALVTRDKTLGLATLCISGGMGLAMLVERVR